MDGQDSGVSIVPLSREHVSATVGWVNDPEIIRLIDRSNETVTLEGCYEWLDRIKKDETKRIFAVLLKDSREHIGNCGLFNIDNRVKKAKLWVYIGRKDLWGKGSGKSILIELMRFGFKELGLNRIYLYIVERNERAARLYESLGFSREGVFRDDTLIDGSYENTVHYSILKTEFTERYENE